MGKLSDHPDFEEVGDVLVYTGEAPEPTEEQRAEYQRQLRDQEKR